jgi:hypothetical protein
VNKLGRGLAVMAAAIVVALIGGGLAVGLAYANPAPHRVLDDARRFVARARTLRYMATVTADLPASDNGAEVTRRSTVQGVGAFGSGSGAGTDYTSTAGTASTEVRSLSGRPGVLIRTGPASAPLTNMAWHSVPNLAELDTAIAQAVARSSGIPYNPDAAAAVILSDELSSADAVQRLFGLAGAARRDGNDARNITASVDGAKAFPDVAGLVGPIVLRVRVDARRRPTSLTVSAREALSAVTVAFQFSEWNGFVAIGVPAPSDVVS